MAGASSSRPDELFLSHASGDRAAADRLADTLRDHGVPVWYSRTEIVGAAQWHDEIGEALNRCDWFAVILSERSVASRWVKYELLFALNEPRYENRVVPIVLEPCDIKALSWALPQIQHVDFVRGFDEGCRALLRIWGIGLKPEK